MIDWLCESNPNGRYIFRRIIDVSYNKGEIARRTREIDDAFQRYTVRRIVEYARSI